MGSRIAAFVLSLAVLASARRAQADTSERFPFLDAPPPTPAPLPPGPAREADEHPRRAWEAFAHADLSAPFCRGDRFGAGQCAETGTGTALGAAALYRFTPSVALGAEASFSHFQVDAPSAAYSRASWMGLLVRGYFLDRGALDPYVEAGIGRGAVIAGSDGPMGPARTNATGPSAGARVGIDFWVTPFLRLGPALSYRWVWLTDVHACVGATCETTAVSERGAVGSYLSLAVHATFGWGHEM